MNQIASISLLIKILQLSTVLLPTEQVKVSIKSHVGDWCIRAKVSRRVIIEKCYWKANIENEKTQEKEQTFDVHPTDIDEQSGIKNEGDRPPTSFLIRLSRSQQKSSSSTRAATSCLSSISSNLTVEKCQLRKSRFRISGQYLTIPHSSLCNWKTHRQPSNLRYKILSSDQSCLEFVNVNSTIKSPPTLSFSTCSSEKVKKLKQTHLWQFCDKTGNCSLSPVELNWSSLIKVDSPGPNNSLCTNDKALTTTTMSPASFQDTGTMTATLEPLETSSNNKNGSYDGNLGNSTSGKMSNMRSLGSWLTLISYLLFTCAPLVIL